MINFKAVRKPGRVLSGFLYHIKYKKYEEKYMDKYVITLGVCCMHKPVYQKSMNSGGKPGDYMCYI